ncbi:histidine kinase [Nostoc sp. C052]|nr:histidine kinase [Nostoc sp. C052]
MREPGRSKGAGSKGEEFFPLRPTHTAPLPLFNAQCPMPNAQCPMKND